ncbi:MAG TPA: hypothetical protein VJ622_16710 [Acidimicrobiia bacterium]|nr:hypothetical protein [Acidimicrobiia bacterium]HTC82118.1 hypothetical protein [Acidimicrobiia bacterium]
MDRRLRRIVGAVTLAVTASVGFGLSAGAQTTGDDQTWVGQVEKHGRHYDYIGRSCPLEETDPCPDYTVRYQIVPTTTQAARALPKVAGHRARLIGHRELVREPGHNGTLVVSEVQSDRVQRDPLTGSGGGQG